MGYVHHGNYAAYFEMGRTELMREYDITYKEMEDNGIILPLSEFYIKYHNPALYDDKLRLVTNLKKFTGVRLIFEYELYNESGTLLAEGRTPLVFANSLNGKPVRPPAEIVDKLRNWFAQ
jgi:acyl-CoA thioester hydrolase